MTYDLGCQIRSLPTVGYKGMTRFTEENGGDVDRSGERVFVMFIETSHSAGERWRRIKAAGRLRFWWVVLADVRLE